MKNLFVSYEIALALKERGFDEECLGCYTSKLNDNNFNQFWFSDQIFGDSDLHPNPRMCKNSDFGNEKSTTSPLYQQVIDWFREKHDIHIQYWSDTNLNLEDWRAFAKFYPILNCDLLNSLDKDLNPKQLFNTVQEAINQGILNAIKLIRI